MSAPPSSSFGASPQLSSNDFSTPSTPATPWLDEFGSWGTTGGSYGQRVADNEPRAKLQSRSGTRHVEEEEDETDEDLEDELADYGYGAPKRRKEKKETLMGASRLRPLSRSSAADQPCPPADILNSEPPTWMAQAPATATVDAYPLPIPQPKRSATLSAKLRQRFGSTGPAPALPASDSLTGLSTLRTSRSASNLLSSLRGRLGSGANGPNRSRDDFSDSPTPSGLVASASQSSLPYVTANGPSSNLAQPERAQARPARKLAAKDAASSAGASTRDLADFLRASGPPVGPYGSANSLPNKPSSLSLGSKPRSTLHKPRASVSKALGQLSARPTHTAASSEAGSLDAGTGGTAILKAAMVKLGTGGRRTSLTPLAKTVGASPGVTAQNGGVDADREGARSNDDLVIGGFGRTPSVSGPVAEHRRRASADAASVMGIADFVATDERRRLELERTRLPVETRAGDLAERATAAGLRRGASQRSATSLNQLCVVLRCYALLQVESPLTHLRDQFSAPREHSAAHLAQTCPCRHPAHRRAPRGVFASSPLVGRTAEDLAQPSAARGPRRRLGRRDGRRHDQQRRPLSATPLVPVPRAHLARHSPHAFNRVRHPARYAVARQPRARRVRVHRFEPRPRTHSHSHVRLDAVDFGNVEACVAPCCGGRAAGVACTAGTAAGAACRPGARGLPCGVDRRA